MELLQFRNVIKIDISTDIMAGLRDLAKLFQFDFNTNFH